MTPSELNTAAREEYNAVGDTFFSDASIYNLITKGCNELALKAKMIEAVSTSTTSVSGTQTYSFPTYAFEVYRVEYNGAKLDPIDFRDDDIVNLYPTTTTTGTPRYYAQWNRTLYLRPIPGTSALTIKIYSYNYPQAVTSTSTLEIPAVWHWGLVDFVLMNMVAKDQNTSLISYYKSLWDQTVLDAIAWRTKKRRADGPAQVKDEDIARKTYLGAR
jgi:hypothetical protein